MALPIVDVEPCDSRPEWGTPIFKWDKAENGILKAGTKLSHEDRIDLLANKQNYIGQIAELRFFEFSDTGVPRFPVYLGLRVDKLVADTQSGIEDLLEVFPW